MRIRRCAVWHSAGILLLIWFCLSSNTAFSQQTDQSNPFGTVDKIFEQFVPMPTEADERALAQITISVNDEQRFGKEMVKAYLAGLKRQRIKVRRGGDDVAYLQDLVNTMKPHMRNANRYPRIDVFVVESEIPDARSFPGGTLFFFEGILELARNEAALIGVVSHELSHLDNGHQLLPLKQVRLMEQSFTPTGGPVNPLQFFEGGTRMARLMSRPFRPQDESAADQDAADWSYAADYDPREFAGLLVRIHERLAATNQMSMPAFLRTHPPALERADVVLARFEELNAKGMKELFIGATNLKRRAARGKD